MAKINILSENIASIIAAGEVVERPASVVKELIENSIDARATKITVKIEDAGKKLIEIIDNGEGMDSEDAKRSLIRHATSKIATKGDLFSIKSLGFRGEAIPSIASVSRLSIETSTGDSNGIKISTEAGKIVKEEITSSRKGTIISVKDLFFNTPARYKFMKADITEVSSITSVVSKAGLGYPEIAFELYIDGRLTLSFNGNGSLIENVGSIYGVQIAKSLIEVDFENFDFKVTGVIGEPQINKSNRNYINLFLNKRPVKIFGIQNKIIEAYGTLLPVSRYPLAVLNIDIDPRLVDVNVHPSKQEVKLTNERELESFVFKEIKSYLSNKVFTPNALEKKEIKSQTFFVKEESVFPPKEEIAFEVKEVSKEISFKENYNPFIKYQEKMSLNKEEVKETTPITIENKQLQIDLFPEEKKHNDLIPLAQIKSTYIIAVNTQGYYLIDQHAAMERINYEKFYDLLSQEKILTTSLLPPLIEIPSNQVATFISKLETFKELGLIFEQFGANNFRLVEFPTWLQEVNIDIYLDEVVNMVLESNINLEQLRRKATATIACKASLKANEILTIPEMENLIKRLFTCKSPSTCPHGRPTMIFYSFNEIEKLFKRTGF